MLENRAIIYFGPERWDGLWRNRHQLMSRFARKNQVLYVEPPVPLRRLLSATQPSTMENDTNVQVVSASRWTPLTGRDPFRQWSINRFISRVRRMLHPYVGNPIVFYSRPAMHDYLRHFQNALSIYHVVDEYSGYGDPSAEAVARVLAREKVMLEAADAAIVVTPTLYADKSRHNPNTFLVENAVDYDAYADQPQTRPADMPDPARPVIGYTGLVAARLDIEMLTVIAKQRRDWNFVFVGEVNDARCENKLAALRDLPNVFLLGNKPVGELPAYVGHFDVCTIPYVLDRRAAHASPLKLFEYAAAGKPIVTTRFAAAEYFSGHIALANGAGEFAAACEAALNFDEDDVRITANRNFAAENTWDHRVEQISSIVNDIEQESSASAR